MKLMFVTRSFPPAVGGMEQFSFHLAQELAGLAPCITLANRKGRMGLPLFAASAVTSAFFAARRGRAQLIHLGDASLAPLGVVLKALTGLPVTASIHGLDITYSHPAYRAVLRNTLPRLDRLIAVSESTREICERKWPAVSHRLAVVPNGVSAGDPPAAPLSAEITRRIGNQRVVLTVGRLIGRKGVAWFVDNVAPSLPSDTVYVVAGEGPMRSQIELEIEKNALGDRVILLGRISENDVDALYRRSAVFVMPNIEVEGDVEGFGLVALEAAVRGLPVVAANLQGIPDAIRHEQNGFLETSADALAFRSRINLLLDMQGEALISLKQSFQEYTRENFSWRQTALSYLREFGHVLKVAPESNLQIASTSSAKGLS